mmetsp:Transcript_70941/g.140796  ORF Transcript_70941/g.140796 Transcript_70941/m.140796 type:complete len:311 (-) Transcript_70941:178-1110(-)
MSSFTHGHKRLGRRSQLLPCLAILALTITCCHYARLGYIFPGALCALGASSPTQPAASPARELLNKARGDAGKMRQAYASIKKLLHADPEDNDLKLAAAEAAVAVMRIESNANSLTCDFEGNKPVVRKQDTEANMKIWAEWAPVASELVKNVQESVGEEAFCNEASNFILSVESTMYATSSKGIVSAVLSGKAISFLSSVTKLEAMHPEFDGLIYCVYWGAYYLAAPWPVTSTKKARNYFEKMVKARPASRRNQYWAGVGAFMEGDYPAAQSYMERALREECASDSERDVCAFLTAEAGRTLQLLAGRQM